MGLMRMAALGAAGYAFYKYTQKDKGDTPKVRDAGAANMETTPKSWSKTDEALDETFPASDAVANY
ncbi:MULTISPECIES: hypothetical protein [Novosphingobium]|uniref:Uncharacterized protein n=1 Tax=Novosphingobium mangrovi (ex Hu et al. 2023) TaxID=2930094 RepID=A0ABT0AAS8_9SPHN|nr:MULTISPECIES: hypothetical protein [Novosphingobium]MCJ1960289.1 hypothetical protein [Novosphingobium mangrovi (ex Hu et al. 2023)]MED5544260.1 hypothetical protein [Pseudomonadota bacterium]